VIEDGEVQHVAVIPMGGIHITNDLAIGLKTDLDVAERVKIEYGSLEAGTESSQQVAITHNDAEHIFEASDIKLIIESRVDEIFEYVEKELKKIHKSQKLPGGVVLVGGTAHLAGIADFAKEKLQLAARTGSINQISGLIDTIDDPSYTTAIGLMMLDMLLADDNAQTPGEPNDGFFGLVDDLFSFAKKRTKKNSSRYPR